MNSQSKNIDGHSYPEFHPGWGGCAEELFHYTSRYYTYTEAFLRNLSGDRSLSMAQYRAANLSDEQRELMALVLAFAPDIKTGQTVNEVINAVSLGKAFVNPGQLEAYRKKSEQILTSKTEPREVGSLCVSTVEAPPLDPFLNLAERLRLPVAVREHHVETSLQQLAEHLDSANSRIRTNLQNAIIQLHNAGYLLRNHPGLTHEEARQIGDEDAV